ncbi:hypothetical protein PVAP13_4NG075019 [Panicum virgatum]|uniref:Uncharacterized protein n=1 Tax=Panicum virgatum TaxID=38727 RepID=A0A8T0T8B1_PANVG|nr:hypothetical protein PVAP13_4NG075019 [Panicum virgatum]
MLSEQKLPCPSRPAGDPTDRDAATDSMRPGQARRAPRHTTLRGPRRGDSMGARPRTKATPRRGEILVAIILPPRLLDLTHDTSTRPHHCIKDGGGRIDGSGSGGGGAAAAAAPFQAAGGGDGEVSAGGRAQVFLAAERGRPVDPVVWGDEERMKRELVAWAKAVASMAAAGKMSTTSSSTPSSPWPSARRRG